MSRGVNKAILVGNLGSDPEIRALPDGKAVANFSVATSERWISKQTGNQEERTEWHRCVCFGRLAEIVEQYVRKGSKVYIEGKLQTRSWEDQSGEKRYMTEILVNDLQMLDSRQDQQPARQPAKQPPVRQEAPEMFDEDIPF